MMTTIPETDLILNADGSAYHINLLPGEIADTVITVGDQDRVAEVSKYFDAVEVRKGKREFVTHTGRIGAKRLTVISTGIGTDNVDIVLNELDALANIDLSTRTVKPDFTRLNIIRIGTSGTVQPDVLVDSLLISEAAIGLDALMHYYNQQLAPGNADLLRAFQALIPVPAITPYLAEADAGLLKYFGQYQDTGITVTAPGFYAPQGRQVRALSAWTEFLNVLQQFNYEGRRITNLEMETAGIYGLAAALGHRAVSCNIILANRATQVFSKNPVQVMDNYIKQVLERVAHLE